MRPALVLALSVAALTVPAVAGAGDGPRERTPTLFEDPPCIAVVDRSADPVFHIEYAIPNEDTALTEDEVSDGRRHQFLALARQPASPLPLWLGADDISAAAALGLTDPDALDPDDVLDDHPAWPAGSWLRITPDAERIPITFAAAAAGIDWDTSGIPAGAYLLDGYTWDPAQSLHSMRWGLVKVVDKTGDADADRPALFLAHDPFATVVEGETLALDACVDALGASTLTAWWAPASFTDDPPWEMFLEDEEVTSGPYVLEFTPPPGTGSQSVRLRAELRDSHGRVYTAYSPANVAVLEQLGDGSSTGAVTTDSGDATGGDSEGDTTQTGGAGCGCRSVSGSGGSTLALLLLLRRRGTRRRAQIRACGRVPRSRSVGQFSRALGAAGSTGVPRAPCLERPPTRV